MLQCFVQTINWDTLKVTLCGSTKGVFPEKLRGMSDYLLFVTRKTRQACCDGKTLFYDGLNIKGGHLPRAIKEALAGAAAFSSATWIKPKSREALPVRLALPPIITDK